MTPIIGYIPNIFTSHMPITGHHWGCGGYKHKNACFVSLHKLFARKKYFIGQFKTKVKVCSWFWLPPVFFRKMS